MTSGLRTSLIGIFAWAALSSVPILAGQGEIFSPPAAAGVDLSKPFQGDAEHAAEATALICSYQETAPPDWNADSQQVSNGWFDEPSLFGGIDGSKQPQDIGVNANYGGQVNLNWGLPLMKRYGVGLQFGSTLVATDNAVQVYELLGEAKTRVQYYNTVGVFQRTNGGMAWGFVYDFLDEDSFDDISLSQWRLRGAYAYAFGDNDQLGVTVNLADQDDSGVFNGPAPTTVTLRAIDQGSFLGVIGGAAAFRRQAGWAWRPNMVRTTQSQVPPQSETNLSCSAPMSWLHGTISSRYTANHISSCPQTVAP